MDNQQVVFGNDYKVWLVDIGKRFKRSQIKAAVKVNEEMLIFYWELGRDIERIKCGNSYGSRFYERISADLAKELPDVKSFSPRNLRYMSNFYNLYSDALNLQQVAAKSDNSYLQQLVANSEIDSIFKIPWGHHLCIMDKCKDNREKALFFVKKTLENNWSRAVLLNFLDTGLFEREGKAVSNFEKALPEHSGDLAQAITKDPYNFDFLSLRQDYDEKELKDALMDNIQSFLLELGTGFAFVGREYRLVIGQTGTYVEAINEILCKEGDGQTIGLLICKTKDNILAKYAVNSSSEPIGISEYQLEKLLPKFHSSMPTIDEIERNLQ